VLPYQRILRIKFRPALQIETKGFPSAGKERPSRDGIGWGVTVIMPLNLESQKHHAHKSWCRSLQIMWLTKVAGNILFPALLFNSAMAFSATVPAGQSVTLAWNASSDVTVTGYKIYYGVASRTYTNQINAGNATSAIISGLVAGVTYYFAATAYDNLGQESGYSPEIIYSVPATLATMQIRSAPAGQFILTVTGLAGQTYQILATQDFTVWTVIGTVTVGTGGSLDFTDTNAASFPQRFYRTQET
jgi:hypothetical protein